MPQSFNPNDPTYYDQYFGYDSVNASCETDYIDSIIGEYIAIYGFRVEVYLCTKFSPQNIFGEDPIKEYLASPFTVKAVWEPTSETLTFGEFDKTANDETIVLYMHKTTTKAVIREVLIEAGLIEDGSISSDELLTKFERNRLDLQEQDMFKLEFNNIHYEIDKIREEPEYQPYLRKYVYEIHARPRLVAGEVLGSMQPVTDADSIREQHEAEIDEEVDELLL
jgi:hypothetical protein